MMKRKLAFVLSLMLAIQVFLPGISGAVWAENASVEATEQAESDSALTAVQQNSINMLNYLTYLTQQINSANDNRLYLDEVYDNLLNNTYPNAVDARTLTEISSLLNYINSCEMLQEKRERLDYIYNQNRAQAISNSLPSAGGLIAAVASRSWLKTAISVLYMAANSFSNYKSYMNDLELEYLQDGWDLDDEEETNLNNRRVEMFEYMVEVVNENDLPGDLALTEQLIEQFVTIQNNTNAYSRVHSLESNRVDYEAFGPYWLTLAESYYEIGKYQECLDCIETYEAISTRIVRLDRDYAEVLPMAIYAAGEVYSGSEYISLVEHYASAILGNTDKKEKDDWELRYFAAVTYFDLYNQTGDMNYMQKAYDVAYDNVNILVDEQMDLNDAYLADVEKVSTKGMSKEEKAEANAYNSLLVEERETALPPVYQPLVLNCDMLFEAAEILGISDDEKVSIDNIMHENGGPLFLSKVLDSRYRFNADPDALTDATIEYGGVDRDVIEIPACYLTADSVVTVTITGENGTQVFDDWELTEVSRGKSHDVSDFVATYEDPDLDFDNYTEGDIVTVQVRASADSEEGMLEFSFVVGPVHWYNVFNPIDIQEYAG